MKALGGPAGPLLLLLLAQLDGVKMSRTPVILLCFGAIVVERTDEDLGKDLGPN